MEKGTLILFVLIALTGFGFSFVVNVMLFFRISDLKQKVARVEEKKHDAEMQRDEALRTSITDDLTGLLNRRGLQMFAEPLFEKLRRSEVDSVELVAIDLSKFKGVNDRYGHQAGDEVLKAVADVLGHCTRAYDHVARVGGDEFVILLSDATTETVDRVMHRAVSMLATRTFDFMGGKSIETSMDYGVVTSFKGHLDTFQKLYQEADDKCYKAKVSSR